MAVTVVDDGSLTANGTEQTLYTTAVSGAYCLVVDLANMQSGDTMTIRVKAKAIDGGTERTVFSMEYSGAQSAPIAISDPLGTPYGFTATIEQTAGTNRAYPFSVELIGDVEVLSENTTTADGTEQTLSTFTTNKNAWLFVDLNNMQAGDTVVIRVKRPCRAADTTRTYFEATFTDVPTDPNAVSIPLPAPYGATVTLEQTGGVNRQYPWSIRAAA